MPITISKKALLGNPGKLLIMENNLPTSGSERFGWIGFGAFIVGILLISFFIDLESMSVWVEKVGIWGPVVFIILKISTLVIAPLSGSALYPLVGILFGFWPGLLYVVIGDTIGCSINFYLSRKWGKKLVFKFISNKEESIVNKSIDHLGSGRGLFHASLTLFAMPELVAYAAGLGKISYLKFISILGSINTIGSVILVLFGSVLAADQQSVFLKFTLPILGIVAFGIGLFLFGREVRRKEGSKF